MGEVRDGEDGPDEELDEEELDDDLEDDVDGDEDGDGGARDADGDDGRLDDDGPDSRPIDREALVDVLMFVAKGLVDNPDAVAVQAVDREGGVTLRLTVDQPDMGKVIGRSGRTARALRTLLRAAGVRAGVSTHVEIVEEER
jgi:predicted RNA-binding protein YlqC (UPF0109 family)